MHNNKKKFNIKKDKKQFSVGQIMWSNNYLSKSVWKIMWSSNLRVGTFETFETPTESNSRKRDQNKLQPKIYIILFGFEISVYMIINWIHKSWKPKNHTVF